MAFTDLRNWPWESITLLLSLRAVINLAILMIMLPPMKIIRMAVRFLTGEEAAQSILKTDAQSAFHWKRERRPWIGVLACTDPVIDRVRSLRHPLLLRLVIRIVHRLGIRTVHRLYHRMRHRVILAKVLHLPLARVLQHWFRRWILQRGQQLQCHRGLRH